MYIHAYNYITHVSVHIDIKHMYIHAYNYITHVSVHIYQTHVHTCI